MHGHTRRKFLKYAGAGAAAFALPKWLQAAQAAATTTGGGRKPNIIFILTDDLGWAELGCCGNTFNETPHLDRLACQGMRFTDAYSAAPVCSPTRAAFMTGQWPARIGITDYLRPKDPKFLSPQQYVALPKMLKRGGYATGLIGKWHLMGDYAQRPGDPKLHGFDEVLCSESQYIGPGYYYPPYQHMPEVQPRLGPNEYLVDRLNLEAVEFIERRKDGPFFLFLSHYAPHTRLVGKPDLVGKYEKKPGAGKGNGAPRNNPHLAAMLESVDEGVGKVLAKLDERGLAANTIVVFYSDNGGEARVTSNAPLRDGKSSLYEGGIRVPLIVRWPSVVAAAATCGVPVSTVDFYPTFAAAAGVAPDAGQRIDGVSLLPALRDSAAKLGREALYWHYPLAVPHFLGGQSAGAVRAGDWKLIRFFPSNQDPAGRFELYNLKDDVGEARNLAETMPDKVKQLAALFERFLKDTAAVIPAPAPDRSPGAAKKTQPRE